MNFKLKRMYKYNSKVDTFIRLSDTVLISRLYDGVMIQSYNHNIINVETGELYDSSNKAIKNACINACKISNIEGLTDGIYQAVGPGLSTNWDGFEENTLMPFTDSVVKKEMDLKEIGELVKNNNWFGAIVTARKGGVVRVYCLYRQFFGLEMTKNKITKQLIDEIAAKVYQQVKDINAMILYKMIHDIVKQSVIQSYILAGHTDDFVEMMINIINNTKH